MKIKNKILILGLMLIVTAGIFSPVVKVNAAPPMGICINTTTSDSWPSLEAACTGVFTWRINSPPCIAPEVLTGTGTSKNCAPPVVGGGTPCTGKDASGANTPANCTPATTPAAASKIYTFLAPLPGLGTTFDPTNKPGENSPLGAYLNVMIKLFIGICAVLAVIMVVMGGIQYMTSELPGNKEAGKERIMHAIFGLLLALGAWTLLNTINPDLLNTDLSSLTTATVEVDMTNDIPQQPVVVNGIRKYGNYAEGSLWDNDVALIVNLPAGVSRNSGECGYVGQQNCTSTRGLNPSTINTILSNCTNCNLTVTAGTEFWLHSVSTSHRPGSSTVDLRVESGLTNYITGGQTPVDWQRYSKDGISFLKEPNHWHAGP